MECPTCGLEVLVQDGALTAHLNPQTLQLCKPSKAEGKPEAKAAEDKETKAKH